jgi:multiple sugar transport system substrate-binding protein
LTITSTLCGYSVAKTKTVAKSAAANDTITALLPPVSNSYQNRFSQIEKEFNAKNPNLTLKLESASWENIDDKLATEVNAGDPPDVSFTGSENIGKYKETGELVDISKYATSAMVKDYNSTALNYMKNGSGLYGLPAYMEAHSIGGNKADMEKAGINWKSVQKSGWTWQQFRKFVKKGIVKKSGSTSRYGFVFACSGVTSKDFFNILVNASGIPSSFTKAYKYAYTDKKVLTILQSVRELINDGSAPSNMSSIDAGKRWNMFLTNSTMITGKGMASFEHSAALNNAKIAKKDGSAVQNSVNVSYVVLPMPSLQGSKAYTNVAVDGYVVFRSSKSTSATHLKNAVKAAYFLDSGKYAALTNTDLYVAEVTNTGKAAAKNIITGQSSYNADEDKKLVSNAAPARPDISADKLTKADKIMDEVIVPKFQSLLSGEITPQQMYDAIKQAAIQQFGNDGIVK